MKYFFILVCLLTVTIAVNSQTKSFHSFKTQTIDGAVFDLSSLKGKKVLVVNTASKCGLTPQYEGLQKLYEKYKDHNFTIIAFPANNFKEQEPGANSEIKEFCTFKYGVTFPLMNKISVGGVDMDPIYHFLTKKSENGKLDAPVKWNFQKFMIDENGQVAGVVASAEKPDSEKIINWIEGKTSSN